MESNKLIAEFMGGEKPERTSDLRHFIEEHHNYPESWDALMPVVQECYKHKHKNALLNAHCVFISAALETVNRKNICDTVINFIKAYNDGTIN